MRDLALASLHNPGVEAAYRLMRPFAAQVISVLPDSEPIRIFHGCVRSRARFVRRPTALPCCSQTTPASPTDSTFSPSVPAAYLPAPTRSVPRRRRLRASTPSSPTTPPTGGRARHSKQPASCEPSVARTRPQPEPHSPPPALSATPAIHRRLALPRPFSTAWTALAAANPASPRTAARPPSGWPACAASSSF